MAKKVVKKSTHVEKVAKELETGINSGRGCALFLMVLALVALAYWLFT